MCNFTNHTIEIVSTLQLNGLFKIHKILEIKDIFKIKYLKYIKLKKWALTISPKEIYKKKINKGQKIDKNNFVISPYSRDICYLTLVYALYSCPNYCHTKKAKS